MPQATGFKTISFFTKGIKDGFFYLQGKRRAWKNSKEQKLLKKYPQLSEMYGFERRNFLLDKRMNKIAHQSLAVGAGAAIYAMALKGMTPTEAVEPALFTTMFYFMAGGMFFSGHEDEKKLHPSKRNYGYDYKDTLYMARDFTKNPKGLWASESRFSAEAFRKNILVPTLKKRNNVKIEISNIDFPKDWLRVAIGGLILEEGFKPYEISEKIQIVSDNPELIQEIRDHISNADKDQKTKNLLASKPKADPIPAPKMR